jgi:dihydrofolate reductase
MESAGQNAMSEPYDVLLGRNTYDAFAPAFSGSESPLDSATKYVVSSRPIDKAWNPTVTISGNVPAAIDALKADERLPKWVLDSWGRSASDRRRSSEHSW